MNNTEPVFGTVGELRKALEAYDDNMPLRMNIDETIVTTRPHAAVLSSSIDIQGLHNNDLINNQPGVHACVYLNVEENDQNKGYAQPNDAWLVENGMLDGVPREFRPDGEKMKVTSTSMLVSDVLYAAEVWPDERLIPIDLGLNVNDAIEIGKRFDDLSDYIMEQCWELLEQCIREYCEEKGLVKSSNQA